MTFAICLQVPNHIHFKRHLSIWAEFIPQLIFLQSIFGYLVICIIMKWCTDWSQPGVGAPPSLLNMLIFMFLSPGTVEDQMFAGQGPLQVTLLLIALICVPWMLITKPYVLWKEHNKTIAQGYQGVAMTDGEMPRSHAAHDPEEEEEGHGNLAIEEQEDDGHGGHGGVSTIVVLNSLFIQRLTFFPSKAF